MTTAPSDHAHVASYYAASARDKRGFSKLDSDTEADVAIIGGGFTGISTAVELTERGLNVVVLEAHKVGWGATGRNGGQITGSLSGDTAMERRFGRQIGVENAREYVWDLRWRGHRIIKNRVQKYGIDCDLRHGHIQTAISPKHMRELHGIHIEAQNRGIADDFEMLDQERVQHLTGSALYIGGLLNTRNMHLHALDLCVGEARAVEKLGGRVFEETEVLRIEHGSRPIVVTAKGKVRANWVITAGNAFHRLEPGKTQGALFPASLSNMVTEPLSDRLVQEINPENLAVYDCRFVLDYFRMTADNRLMFGSGTNYGGRADPDVAAALRPALLNVYPQLKNVKIDYAWSCTDGITANRIPQVGRIADNVLFAQGYSGHGIALTHIMGEILANAVTGNSSEFNMYEKVRHLRLPYARTFGSQLQAIGMAIYKAKDRITALT